MIEYLSVSNFYCYKDKTTLYFTTKKERKRNGDPRLSGFTTQNKVNILKMIYLYGNNGSGKSKMLCALKALQYLIIQFREQKQEELKFKPFAFDEHCYNNPSTIEIVYHIKNVRYFYKIMWNNFHICEEELKELKPKSEVLLFHRWHDEDSNTVQLKSGIAINLSDKDENMLNVSVSCRNSIFSTAIENNISNQVIREQYNFFKNGFEIIDINGIDLNKTLPNDNTKDDRNTKRIITELLSALGVNIISYDRTKEEIEISPYMKKRIANVLKDEPDKLKEILSNEKESTNINVYHKTDYNQGNVSCLSIYEQSDGTKEILRMFTVINESIRHNKTIILDNYNSNIQRNALNQLIKFFIAASSDSQIVISTQDYGMVDFDIVRRDSIRFFFKDSLGEAHIESIDLSKLHKNSSLYHYVSKMNAYGQLPNINEKVFKEIIEEYTNLNIAEN